MKVLIYTHEFPPFQGGIATSAKRIAEIISTKNELIVCCPSYSIKNTDNNAYQIKRIDFPGGRNFKKIPLIQYFVGLLNLKDLVLKFKPDKILYLGEEAEIVGSLFNSKANNQIVRIAGSGIEAIIKSRNPIKIIPKYLLRRLYRNSSIIIAVSKNTKMLMEGYEKFFPKEKIRLVYNGIDADFISKEKVRKIRKDLGFNENDFVLLTVGRLLPRKGQDFVIKAMSQINNPKIKYICVGEGRFLDKYKRLVSSLNLNERVFFVGGVTNKSIHEYYDAADLFVLCNRTWNSKIEGLPNVVLESMARGVPAIGSRNSGTEELIIENKTGFLVNPYDVNDIINKINHAYATRKELDQMGEQAKTFIKDNFNYNKMKDEYLRLIDSE